MNHLLARSHSPLVPPLSTSNSQWEQTTRVVIPKPSARKWRRYHVDERRGLCAAVGLLVFFVFVIVALENVLPAYLV